MVQLWGHYDNKKTVVTDNESRKQPDAHGNGKHDAITTGSDTGGSTSNG